MAHFVLSTQIFYKILLSPGASTTYNLPFKSTVKSFLKHKQGWDLASDFKHGMINSCLAKAWITPRFILIFALQIVDNVFFRSVLLFAETITDWQALEIRIQGRTRHSMSHWTELVTKCARSRSTVTIHGHISRRVIFSDEYTCFRLSCFKREQQILKVKNI